MWQYHSQAVKAVDGLLKKAESLEWGTEEREEELKKIQEAFFAVPCPDNKQDFLNYENRRLSRENLTRLYYGDAVDDTERPDEPVMWVSDGIVNFFVKVMRTHISRKRKRKLFIHEHDRMSGFKSAAGAGTRLIFDWNKVFSGARAYTGLSRGINKHEPKGVHVFPVCESCHWSLIIIDFDNQKADFLDPYGWNNNKRQLCKVRAFLAIVYSDTNNSTESETITEDSFEYRWAIIPHACRQERSDTDNCGLYVIMIMMAIVNKIDLVDDWSGLTSQECCPVRAYYQRRELFVDILACGGPIRTGMD